MSFSLIENICCPFCGGRFTHRNGGREGFGILSCHCDEYPILAGIPILRKGVIGLSNETVSDVISLIKAGRLDDALLCMIMPPPPPSPSLAPGWLQSLPSIKGIGRLQYLAHKRAAQTWSEEATAMLTEPDEEVTACDLLDLYYHRSGFKWNDAYDYFGLRFGQPRHLVALSFTTLIDKPTRPILDLACGFGHLTWSLARRAHGQTVVGIDQNFIGLYMAKRFISPKAEYICCVADGPLPFKDGFFSAVFCSDAFHYFVNKATTFHDLKRLTHDDGMIVMVWMHNIHVRRPHDGIPLPPEGYQAVVGDMPHRIVADSDVLSRYLQKKGPALSGATDLNRLSNEPMLSVVASRRQEIFRDHGTFAEWPHAEGKLSLNPLYIVDKTGALEDLRLRRTYPSTFFMEDHSESKQYLPEIVNVRSPILADLAHGRRTSDVETLVGQFVALGMPDRFR